MYRVKAVPPLSSYEAHPQYQSSHLLSREPNYHYGDDVLIPIAPYIYPRVKQEDINRELRGNQQPEVHPSQNYPRNDPLGPLEVLEKNGNGMIRKQIRLQQSALPDLNHSFIHEDLNPLHHQRSHLL